MIQAVWNILGATLFGIERVTSTIDESIEWLALRVNSRTTRGMAWEAQLEQERRAGAKARENAISS